MKPNNDSDDGGDGDGDGNGNTTQIDFDFDLSRFNKDLMNTNNGKPPPQPATAAVNSIHWDVEEDHLLSYFLGANEGGNENAPGSESAAVQHNSPRHEAISFEPTMVRPASQPNNSVGGSMASIAEAESSGVQAQVHHSSLENFVHARARDSSDGLTSNTSSSSAGLPPTPFFYDGHNRPAPSSVSGSMPPMHTAGYNSFVQASQHQRLSSNSLQNRSTSAGSIHKVPSRASTTSTGSSSSSSLTSMAAALALGGPNQVMYVQQKLQNRDQVPGVNHHLNNSSPITPVQMMGSPSGHEMMMLPPPPRFPNGVAPGMMQHPQNMQQNNMGQQQHIMHPQQQMPMQQQQQMQQQMTMQQQQQQMHMSMQQQQMQQQMNMQQQQQQQMSMQQQIQQPQVVQSQTTPTLAARNAQKQPNFLPQMNPPAGVPGAQQPIQHPHPPMAGFPDPNSVASTVLAQPQPQMQPPQQQVLQQQIPQQQVLQQQVPQQQIPQGSQQIQIGLNGQTIPITAVPGADGSVHYHIDPSVVPAAGLRYFTKAINEVSKPEEKEIDPKVLAEKRQQRLARNRESARQSRRRKKEHLSNLAAKVQSLQRQLETEVRNKIRSMEAGLLRQRTNMMEKWLAGYAGERKQLSSGAAEEQNSDDVDKRRRKELTEILNKTGVNSPIRRAVVAHQYNSLRQAFLSNHNHYAVWMMMQSSSFFTEASRRQLMQQQRSDPSAGDKGGSGSAGSSKTNASRANSKQIGEEIYNKERKEGKGSITCNAHDELRMWPLYCHEITMTMEQEDRIINQAHTQARNTPNLQSKLQKIKTATDATRHLQNAMLCHTQLAAERNQNLLLEILTPTQTALFLEWFKKNKERCRALMEQQLRNNNVADGKGEDGNVPQTHSTLGGVSKDLEEMRLKG